MSTKYRDAMKKSKDNLTAAVKAIINSDSELKECTWAKSPHTDVYKLVIHFLEIIAKSPKLTELSTKNAVRALIVLLKQAATLPTGTDVGIEDIDALLVMPIETIVAKARRSLEMTTPEKEGKNKKKKKKVRMETVEELEEATISGEEDEDENEENEEEENEKRRKYILKEEERAERAREEESYDGQEEKGQEKNLREVDVDEQVEIMFGFRSVRKKEKDHKVTSVADPNGKLKQLIQKLARTHDEIGKRNIMRDMVLEFQDKRVSDKIQHAIVPNKVAWGVASGRALLPYGLCDATKLKKDIYKPMDIYVTCNENIQEFLEGTFTALLELVITHCFGSNIMKRVGTNNGRCKGWVSTLNFIQDEVSTQVDKLQTGFSVELEFDILDEMGQAHTLTQIVYLLDNQIALRLQHLESTGVPKDSREYKVLKTILESNKQQQFLIIANSHPSSISILKEYRDAQKLVKERLGSSNKVLDKILTQPIISEEALTKILNDFTQLSKRDNKEFTTKLKQELKLKSSDKGGRKLEANITELSTDISKLLTYKEIMKTVRTNIYPHNFKKFDNSTSPPTIEEFELQEVLMKATGMDENQIKKVLGEYVCMRLNWHSRVHELGLTQLLRPKSDGKGKRNFKGRTGSYQKGTGWKKRDGK